jgi:type VI secretion system FHA domain protein
MALRLQIVSRHRQSLGDRGAREFGHNGGTIGRSLESDWVLPDGQRYISSRHASIDYRSGSYYIVDTSTNGVYVNDAEQPVGRGNPQRLFAGDRIRLGEYEISVEIEGEDDTNAHFAEDHVDPVSRAQRVPPPDPTRADLIQAHEITAVGIEMMLDEEAKAESLHLATQANAANLRLADDPPPSKHAAAAAAVAAQARPPTPQPSSPAPPPVSAAARVAAAPPGKPPTKAAAASGNGGAAKPGGAPPPERPPPASTTEAAAPPIGSAARAPAPPASRAPAASSSALDAFFRGAGLAPQKVDDKAVEETLHRLGQVMREVILGITENLHVRTDQKGVLRLPNTTIQPQNNNPLKFSASVDEALSNLLLRRSAEYLGPAEAVREAFVDIKQHQQTLMSAVRVAISDYVGRLDPDELENKFTSGKRGGLMSAAHKLKYWDLYKDLYQVVTSHQPQQLPQQFLEDLARAYETENARAGGPAAGKPQSKIAG